MPITFRKYVDCREFPSEINCSLTIAGTEAEILKAAAEHAVSSHGHEDGSELRAGLQKALREER